MVLEGGPAVKKKVAELRGLARECMKTDRSTEAFLHLSHALRLDEDNRDLLVERSRVCSGEACQYHFAMEDAKRLVELDPTSWLGHHRTGEVLMATHNYQEALEAFQRAFQCNDSDKVLCKELMDKSKREAGLDQRQAEQIPWVGSALGMAISSLILVLDYLSHGHSSVIAHPLLKVLVCILAAGIGYWGAVAYRGYTVRLRKQVVEPPVDLLGEMMPPNASRPHQD